MVAELENISYDDGGGFCAAYLNEMNGFWHFHPEYELVLNIKSYGTRIIGDSVELFDQYDMTLIAGNIPHCWNHYKQDGILPENHGIVVHFKLSSLGESLMSQYEMHGVKSLMREAERGIAFTIEDAKEAEKYLIEMINSKGIDKMINFFIILGIMVSSDKRHSLCSENYRIEFDQQIDSRMSEAYTFIHDNFNKHISLENTGRIVKMSPFAFGRYFKKNCGAGFVEYLNQVRTNKACYLLRETEHQIHDIAIDCGFGSISNFNKQFKKTIGFSPRDYRTQFR
jgi:AraC-like DNA-binding protein